MAITIRIMALVRQSPNDRQNPVLIFILTGARALVADVSPAAGSAAKWFCQWSLVTLEDQRVKTVTTRTPRRDEKKEPTEQSRQPASVHNRE
jgi:hypothetical protein